MANGSKRILAVEPMALPPDLAARTDVLPETGEKWWERTLGRFGFQELARRSRQIRRAWALLRRASEYAAVITLGDFEGLVVAWLEKLRGRGRPAHVMYDCLWYGGSGLKRWWMRSCLKQVDRCVVWASVERRRYANAYNVDLEKFVFVPHHHTLHHFTVEVGDEAFVFTGGNQDRDWKLFLDAVRDLNIPCILATNRLWQLEGISIPPNVRVLSATPQEFRRLMAKATLVVMPMRANLLHAGAQQSILNAMLMGKPVILTDPEGGADYIDSGITGQLVPYGDVASLREAIELLWDHRDRARIMGERARLAAAPLTTIKCNTSILEHVTAAAVSGRDLEFVAENRALGIGGSSNGPGTGDAS
jgi:glycosyltransferase involved in cell wall biosynthesis